MQDIIKEAAQQLAHSLEFNHDVKVAGNPDSIIFAGMGGSWHPGELLNALELPTVPLWIHRDYDLAYEYTSNPLVICSSYSGNTEEALSAYAAAKNKKYPILINTSGGQLEKNAQQDGVPVTKIDYPGMQPRHTTFASFAGVYIALKNSGLVKDIESELLQVAQTLTSKTPQLEGPAKKLAAQINGTIPVYYASASHRYAAWNFKIQTNENAKHPAYWNEFPELNHNEMLGFSKLPDSYEQQPPNFHVIMLRSPDDHPRTKARMDVTTDLYRSWGTTVSHVTLEGDTRLEQIFYAIIFGLWTTYHLALLHNIKPVPVEGVESFKQALKDIAGDL